MSGDYLTLIGLGGCCEVGRSCFLLRTPRSAILLDCGMSFTDGAPSVLDVIAPAQLDGIILTHAHLDHVGYIPALCDHGFRGTILATSETVALAEVLLRDYWGLGPCPNFTLAGLSTALGCCTPLQPHETSPLGDLQVRFLKAGHVMGAVMAEVRYKSMCLLYTGDISSSTLLEGGCAIHGRGRYDYVICESTYGNTKRKADSSIRLATIIRSCLTEEGCALIPAFAVGRAQEVLTAIGKIFRYGTVKTNESESKYPTTPKLHRHKRPILVVDGMIEKVNQLYLHFRPDDDKLSFIKEGRFTFPRSTARRQEILNTIGPKIIVSTGGMLEGLSGMYYDALKEDARNLLIFVGYQAQGTRGRSILDGHGRDGKIQIENISLSAHADIRELTDSLSWIETKKLYIVHGETAAAQGLLTASKSFACLDSEILKPLEEQLLYTSVDAPLKPSKNGALNKNDGSVDTEEGEFLSVPVKVEPPHTLLNNKRALRLMLKEIILAVDSYSMPEIEEILRSWNVERLAQFGLNILEDELLIAAEQIKEAVLSRNA